MNIDLNKLSLAPWTVGEPPYHEVLDAEGIPVNQKGFRADMEFEALARNAFDVMMRRGWYAVGHVRRGNSYSSWIVLNSFGVEMERGGNTGIYFVAADPFTCLDEADRWYKENVEQAGAGAL